MKMIVRNMKDIPGFEITARGAQGVTIKWLTEKRLGGDNYLHNFAVRFFEIKPGGFWLPGHVHAWDEAFVILSGRMAFTSGEETKEVSSGDVVYVPANEPHHGRNPSDKEPLTFMCVIGCVGDKSNCVGPEKDIEKVC